MESSLLELMQKDELEQELSGRIGKFQGLLTREAAMRLMAKERGLLEEKFCGIPDIHEGQRDLSIKARVKRVWPMATYSSGKRSRVIEVEDGKGAAALVLWNGDAESGKCIRKRDLIIVRGAYERNGELHLGQGGNISFSERSDLRNLRELEEDGYSHVRGIVSRVDGIDSFVREGAVPRVGFAFFVSDGGDEVRCVIWEGLSRGEKLTPGDEVILENALFHRGELGISDEGRILSRKAQEVATVKKNGISNSTAAGTEVTDGGC